MADGIKAVFEKRKAEVSDRAMPWKSPSSMTEIFIRVGERGLRHICDCWVPYQRCNGTDHACYASRGGRCYRTWSAVLRSYCRRPSHPGGQHCRSTDYLQPLFESLAILISPDCCGPRRRLFKLLGVRKASAEGRVDDSRSLHG
jgi:hypothetical protein